MTWQPLPQTRTAQISMSDREFVYIELLAWRIDDDNVLTYMAVQGILIEGRKVIRFT